VAEVVVELRSWTEFAAAVVVIDNGMLVLASASAKGLVFALADEWCWLLAATMPALLFPVQLAATWLARDALLPFALSCSLALAWRAHFLVEGMLTLQWLQLHLCALIVVRRTLWFCVLDLYGLDWTGVVEVLVVMIEG
jgi:hypothetical protein